MGADTLLAAVRDGSAWSYIGTAHEHVRLHLVIPLGLGLGLLLLFVFYPLLQRLCPILRWYKPLHYEPLSDIPGIPEHYDWALICALRTLPDPHNFIGAYSDIPLKRGVKFRIRMPICRYFSISLYPGMFDKVQDVIPPSLADHEVAYNPDGTFTVVLSEKRPEGDLGSNWLPTQGVSDGLLVFRRYGTPEGVKVDYPEIRRLDDNALLKPRYSTVAGAWSVEQCKNHRYRRLLRVLKVACLAAALMLAGGLTAWEVDAVLVMAALMLMGMDKTLWAIGGKRASELLYSKTKGRKHEAIVPSLEFGKASARPHPMHKYYVFEYDATQGDVVVSGLIPPRSELKYWSLVLYDWHGMPSVHNYSDETIVGKEGREKGSVQYTVTLTTGKTKAPADYPGNVMDVSENPTGACLVRVIYPESDAVFEKAKPIITVVPPPAKKSD